MNSNYKVVVDVLVVDVLFILGKNKLQQKEREYIMKIKEYIEDMK
jgi:hypothetical protein